MPRKRKLEPRLPWEVAHDYLSEAGMFLRDAAHEVEGQQADALSFAARVIETLAAGKSAASLWRKGAELPDAPERARQAVLKAWANGAKTRKAGFRDAALTLGISPEQVESDMKTAERRQGARHVPPAEAAKRMRQRDKGAG